MKKDSLAIDGKTYLSSKRAAEIAGYSKDYVGQLCRSGKLECRMVGRLWYVDEKSIRKHQAESFKANQTSFRSADLAGSSFSPPARLSAGPFSVSLAIPNSFSADMPSAIPSPFSAPQVQITHSLRRMFLAIAIIIAVLASGMTILSLINTLDVPGVGNPANVYSAWSRVYGGFFSFVSPHASTDSSEGNESDNASLAHAGLVVVPSAGSATNTKLAQTITNSFSDNVTVTPGPNGTTGVITPEFRTVNGHDFLYVLVPVKTGSSTTAPTSTP